MKIIIGSDHGGYELKEYLKTRLDNLNIDTIDLGVYFDNDTFDYPIMGKDIAKLVLTNKEYKGIAICGTGIGISIAVNRFKGIRGALCTSTEMAKLSKQHNDSNILVLGGRTTKLNVANDILNVWLNTKFDPNKSRHCRRINQLDF
jgi:ribose 5-phosphate isomerase B